MRGVVHLWSDQCKVLMISQGFEGSREQRKNVVGNKKIWTCFGERGNNEMWMLIVEEVVTSYVKHGTNKKLWEHYFGPKGTKTLSPLHPPPPFLRGDLQFCCFRFGGLQVANSLSLSLLCVLCHQWQMFEGWVSIFLRRRESYAMQMHWTGKCL